MRITTKGIYVIIEYSLIEKINIVLSTIITSNTYRNFGIYSRTFTPFYISNADFSQH